MQCKSSNLIRFRGSCIHGLLFLALSLIPLSGYGETLVGGHCNYESILGTARLASTGEAKQFYFHPVNPVPAEAKVNVSKSMRFTARQPSKAVRKDIDFPARLSVITEGSCTPYRFMLLSSEYFSHRIFVPVDKHGRLSESQEHQLQQLSSIYQQIRQSWPNLVIEVCGTTGSNGSQEYNEGLANHYAQRVSDRLQSYGIEREKIHTSSTARAACPGMELFSDEGGDGANVRYHLTGPDRLNKQDIRSAESGDKSAQGKLLATIIEDDSSDPDKMLAAPWVLQAAKQGMPQAQYAAGLAYFYENGVPQDLDAGIHWTKAAAFNNYAPAQRELASMYFNGARIQRNHPLAYAWYLIAAENGDEEAKKGLVKYERYADTALEYNRTDLAKGKALVNELKAKITRKEP